MRGNLLWSQLDATQVQYKSRDHIKLVGDYAIGRRLGEGSYGRVKEGVHLNTKRRVAIKIYSRKRIKAIAGAEESSAKEIEILKSLQHVNVVYAIDSFVNEQKEKIYIVMEYVNGGTLQGLLDKAPESRLPLRQVRQIFKGTIKGLLYLQGQGIVHRDIKPDNILLTVDGEVKITDFGVAVRIPDAKRFLTEEFPISEDVPDPFKTGEGSPAFQPPECQEIESNPDLNGAKKRTKFPFKLDVWSSGVVLFIMATGKYPFESKNLLSLFASIARGEYKIPDFIDDILRDLISGILTINPKDRLSFVQIQKHPWMKYNLPKENFVKIEPLASMFGHDQKSLLSVLENLQSQSPEPEESQNISEDYKQPRSSARGKGGKDSGRGSVRGARDTK